MIFQKRVRRITVMIALGLAVSISLIAQQKWPHPIPARIAAIGTMHLVLLLSGYQRE